MFIADIINGQIKKKKIKIVSTIIYRITSHQTVDHIENS